MNIMSIMKTFSIDYDYVKYSPAREGYPKPMIIYPKELKGKELFKPVTDSIDAFVYYWMRKIFFKLGVKGILRDEIKEYLNKV